MYKKVILSFFVSASFLFAQEKAYDVRSAIVEYHIVAEVGASKDYSKGKSKLYFKDFGSLELNDSTMLQRYFNELEEERVITKIEKSKMYTVDFDNEEILSSNLAFDEEGSSRFVLNKENLTNMGAKFVGIEKVLGYDCEVWQLGDDRIWSYKGVALKQISKSLSGMKIIEAKLANFNIDINNDKFKLPNFPIIQMDEMISNIEEEGEF